MNTQIKIIRFVLSLVLALGALGITPSVAFADQPVKSENTFSLSDVMTDICSFPVSIESTIKTMEVVFSDEKSGEVRIFAHVTEQDIFSANGKTLVGDPFRFNIEIMFDSEGNAIKYDANGIVEKVRISDGSLFISAGKIDFLAHSGELFVLSADRGNPGNIDAFCAALSG